MPLGELGQPERAVTMKAFGPKNTIQVAAGILSYLLHPALLMIGTVVCLSAQIRNGTLPVLRDAMILSAALCPGLVYLVIQKRRGRISHFHLLRKEERRVILPMLLGGVAISYGVYYWIGTPAGMLHIMLIGILSGAGAVLISEFWKISLHAAVPMACAVLIFPEAKHLALAFFAAGFIVGISRLIQHHHTATQVLCGWAYGTAITALLSTFLGR